MVDCTDTISYAYLTGHMFTPNERIALSTSLPLLATKTKRRRIIIWGKVFGFKSDYIVVQAYDDDLVAEPQLFYTTDEGMTFTLLGTTTSLLTLDTSDPIVVQKKKMDLIQKMRGSFMGDPSYEYRIVDDVTGEVRSYKESLRLALFIEEHDHHCRVAPRGAYYQEQRGSTLPAEIKKNEAFKGLPNSVEGALSLSHYYHLRPANPFRRLLAANEGILNEKSALEKISENRFLDAVFDPLTDDIPSGLWRLRFEPTERVVVGTNARFPGSIFYHVPTTSKYGTIYIGNGCLNRDVAFEI